MSNTADEVRLKLGELLETPESLTSHNVAGNCKREGLKIVRIGQSAAKPRRDAGKVQRLTAYR
jgi:hypothetical protein